MTLTRERLSEVVAKDAAIRRVQRLQPAGGAGDKVFPPTYLGEGPNAPPRHVFETRRINGQDVRCVLLDSVQSQANRLEEALRDAMREGRLRLPHLVVDFSGKRAEVHHQEYDLSDIGQITVLDAPHRIFDAIIRDSEYNSTQFPSSEVGKRLQTAKPQNALAVFEVSPTALLFGVWNSHGEGGGLGAKFARCLVSEIVGVNAAEGWRTSSRLDPLGIRAGIRVQGGPLDWEVAQDNARRPSRPSGIGHSNIAPEVTKGGVTVDYALHTAVISCAGLRRLRFPGTSDENAGRTVLAALGLTALTLQDEAGYALRSRCNLVCDGRAPFEVVRSDGTTESFDMSAQEALSVFQEAVDKAREAGFPWNEEPIRLTPQKKLVELVAISRAKGLAGELETEEQ